MINKVVAPKVIAPRMDVVNMEQSFNVIRKGLADWYRQVNPRQLNRRGRMSPGLFPSDEGSPMRVHAGC